jgi:hypothetical protein
VQLQIADLRLQIALLRWNAIGKAAMPKKAAFSALG